LGFVPLADADTDRRFFTLNVEKYIDKECFIIKEANNG
jgi:hypothetical protein